MLSYVALFFIFLIIIVVAAAIVFLGSLPGKIARQRNHPWSDAVNAASWIGLATGALWPLAFVWAFLPVPQRSGNDARETSQSTDSSGNLEKRIAALEASLKELRSQTGEGQA